MRDGEPIAAATVDRAPAAVDRAPAAVFKTWWEDFAVDEIPGSLPTGAGDPTWLLIEKQGLTTHRAAADLARALGVKPGSVGYAGLKDARSVARQWLSVERVEPARALATELPRVRVLRAERHPCKLRRGWHAGNRFRIRLRPASDGAPLPALGAVSAVLERLAVRGVPNYYGPQRFGSRGDTWRVGRALARERWEEAAALIAGRPLRPGDPTLGSDPSLQPDRGDILLARELYEAGEYAAAAGAWPRGYGQCARLAAAMERTGGDAARALPVVGKRMLRLYAAAYQAWLFNRVVAARAGELDRLMEGDVAWKHGSEALFPIADPAAEQTRAAAFEISPTGPLVGRRMRQPAGATAALEARVLEEAGFAPAELDSAALRPLTGRRRPLRFPVRDALAREGRDEAGAWLELSFALPPGCYATTVLRELPGTIMEGRGPAPGAERATG